MKISVLIKEPGKNPRHVHIENSLKNLQKTVDGYIECVTLATDCVVICDEEGRLKGKPWCCDICGVDFCGTVVICGTDGEEFADLPGDWKTWKQVLANLWEDTE